MNGKIRLATNPQILVLAIAWLAVCMGIDYTFNRTSGPDGGGAPARPLLRINHLAARAASTT
jgi:hypothetical protein